MILPTCKCCGQTLPRDSPFEMVSLTPQQYRIVQRIKKAGKHGITTEMLIDHVYANDPDGGPVTAAQTLHVQVMLANRELRKIGFKVASTCKGRRDGEYRITQAGAPA